MTTTKAAMIAITKHETHSYYVIILTFTPVILHCSSSFALQWKLICIFFSSESLWDFFFLIQTESHKNYTPPHQFTQSHVIKFFFSSWSFVSTFLSSSVFHESAENAYSFSSAVQSVTRTLYLSESLPWISWRWNPLLGTYLPKHQSTPRTVCKWEKT